MASLRMGLSASDVGYLTRQIDELRRLVSRNVQPPQVGFPAVLTGPFDPLTGYPWAQQVLDVTVPGVVAQTTPRKGKQAHTPGNNKTLPTGQPGWLEIDPQAAGWLFLADCCTSVCDPCPLVNPKPTSLYVGNPSAGCALSHCNVPARIVWQGSVSNQWIGDFACIGGGGGGDCVCISHVALRCVGNVYVADITRNSNSVAAVSYTGLPVILSSCSPFCATFTVPGDAVCAGATTYTISDDSTFASCQSCCANNPPPIVLYMAITSWCNDMGHIQPCSSEHYPIQLGTPSGPYKWQNTSDPGCTGICVCVRDVFLFCTTQGWMVQLSIGQDGGEERLQLPVNVTSCNPFCGTFTVPAGHGQCIGAAQFSISSDPSGVCGSGSGSGGGSGGGGGITWSAVGQGKGFNNISSLTYSATVPANSLLVVSVGRFGASISGVTFNGVAMTAIPGTDRLWYLKVVAGTSANVVVTSSLPNDVIMSSALAVTGLTNFTPDVYQTSSSGGGTGHDVTTGSFGPTTHAAEIWVGVVFLEGNSGSPNTAMGSWIGPFTDTGQDQTLTGITSGHPTINSALLTTGVEVAAVIGSPNVDVTGATYDAGYAVGATFS